MSHFPPQSTLTPQKIAYVQCWGLTSLTWLSLQPQHQTYRSYLENKTTYPQCHKILYPDQLQINSETLFSP